MDRSASGSKELKIKYLEKINELIDLCIDSELYDYLKKKIIPRGSLGKEAKKQLDNLPNLPKIFTLDVGDYPVRKVFHLDELEDSFSGKYPNITPLLLKDPLLNHWSKLFWAKLVRSEIKRLNRRPWSAIYDDLILYLESNIPAKDTKSKSWNITLFNYLMELSAVDQGEASIGYAERARKLLEGILDNSQDAEKQRNDNGDPYDRWIWYNKAVAYQHMGRNQVAAREFDTLISKFRKDATTSIYNFDKTIEFLLNIVPAVRQRAEANLQLQLNYHALQFLAEGNIYEQFDVLERSKTEFYRKIVERLKLGIDLLRLEALLKLDEDNKVDDLFNTLYKSVFKHTTWSSSKQALPDYTFSTTNPASSSQVRLIEHTVAFYLREANHLLEDIKDYEDYKGTATDKKANLASAIDSRIHDLPRRLDSIKEQYWSWVENNEFDEKIYYSRWAQFLGVCAKIVRISAALPQCPQINSKHIVTLFNSLILLYKQHQASLPCHRNLRTSENVGIIRLEALRSDDFPDIEKGLNDFYSELLNIRENEKIPHGMKKEFSKIITSVLGSTAKDPLKPLREDHFKVLEAIDDYEVEFGERQRVKSLMRCNIRSRWESNSKRTVPCAKCWQPQTMGKNKKTFFHGLLKCCQNSKPRVNNDNKQYYKLNNNDYELIMSLAEKEFTKRLEKASEHAQNDALHFLGLQRWNSLTPAQGRSVGGGYFLYRTDEHGIIDLGIAIDPGFDFVRNFLRSGFSIRDINFILISHAHADHLWDFESIVQLLKELDEKKHIKHRINVILTLSAYEKYERHVIQNRALREFIEPYVIDVGKGIDPDFFGKLGIDSSCRTGNESCVQQENLCFRFWKVENGTGNNRNNQWRWKPVLPLFSEPNEVEIWPTCAYHDDYSNISDSFGFIIGIRKKMEEKPFVFGYTGDTRWVGDELYNEECHYYRHPDKRCRNKDNIKEHWTNVAKQYRSCNALLVHIGSLIDHKNDRKFKDYESQSDCDQLIRDKNHPYLMGMIRLLSNIYRYKPKKDKLILVGEFGEELRGGIRVNIVSRLQAALTPSWPVIPVDVGLDIVLKQSKSGENGGYDFICALCDESRSIGSKEKNAPFASKIEYHCYGHDEAIFYICDTCYKSIPEDVRQDRLRQLYETGRELKTEPDPRG